MHLETGQSEKACALLEEALDTASQADDRRCLLYAAANLALVHLRRGEHLIVWQGADGIAVLPHKDVMLGPPRPNQMIVAGRRVTPNGEEFEVMALDRDDPRLPKK